MLKIVGVLKIWYLFWDFPDFGKHHSIKGSPSRFLRRFSAWKARPELLPICGDQVTQPTHPRTVSTIWLLGLSTFFGWEIRYSYYKQRSKDYPKKYIKQNPSSSKHQLPQATLVLLIASKKQLWSFHCHLKIWRISFRGVWKVQYLYKFHAGQIRKLPVAKTREGPDKSPTNCESWARSEHCLAFWILTFSLFSFVCIFFFETLKTVRNIAQKTKSMLEWN